MEQAADYIHIPPIPEGQKDALRKGDLLWKDDKTRMFYPENPLIPASEGMHVRIESKDVPLHPKTSEEWQGWLQHWAKTIGVGKVISEGRSVEDMWQNFLGKTEYSPEGYLVTDVIGRSPEGKSWGQTAPLPDAEYDNRASRLSPEKVSDFSRVLTRYVESTWMPEMKKVSLFEKDPVVSPPSSPRFEEVYDRNMHLPFPWASEPLLVSDVTDVVAILEPHLKTGIHLMVGVNQAPKRPWRDMTRSLQALAVAEQTAQILEKTTFAGEPIASWTSVRATGSWSLAFFKLLDDQDYKNMTPRKWLKRRFRGAKTAHGEGEDWNMFFHPHIYGARYADEAIRLTKRPRHEGGADWEGIEPFSQGRRKLVRDVLNKELFPTLLTTIRGPIFQGEKQ